ncbi:MAG: energy-coupling factor transporter ATPase [Clostridia bacterium]|nr:energy-coupling factor transporter ATPase [Clostridia bacterium]
MAETFIRTEGLCFSYKDDEGRPILHNINIDIKRGEFLCILGRNGSGKSTFAKLLNMILTPDAGKIYVDGVDITDPGLTEEQIMEVRRKVGMVFQNPDNQLVATIVEEDVAFGPENMGVPSDEIRERVDRALETVGMTEYARHSPSRLSGGQKQRIAIAGILAMMPECIIFDESTAMLDPHGRHEVMETIDRLNEMRSLTVIAITHNMDEAILADRIAVMDGGRIVMDGSPAEIFSREEELTAMGLGVPQAAMLANRLRRAGMDLPEGLLDERSAADAIASAINARKRQGT